MKTPTLLLALTLSLVAGGCIDTKDVGVESDASSGGSTSEGSGASGASGAASTSGASSSTATTLTTASGGESNGETDAGVTTLVSGTESSTGSDTDGGEAEELCVASGGGWEPEACGDYVCGLPQDCDAVIPGCDCGEHRVFIEGVGCQVGDECEPYEFDCGEELCLAPNHYCDVSIPGVKGPTSYECADMPVDCEGDYSCECLDAQGLVAPGECEMGPEVGAITVTTAKP